MATAEKMILSKFQKEFRTEEDCESYLAAQRWANVFNCPKCNHDQSDTFPF